MKKKEAISEANSRGFTIQFDTGEANGYPLGSLLKFRKPGCSFDKKGRPNEYAEIIRIKGYTWSLNIVKACSF